MGILSDELHKIHKPNIHPRKRNKFLQFFFQTAKVLETFLSKTQSFIQNL